MVRCIYHVILIWSEVFIICRAASQRMGFYHIYQDIAACENAREISISTFKATPVTIPFKITDENINASLHALISCNRIGWLDDYTNEQVFLLKWSVNDIIQYSNITASHHWL